VNLLQTWLIVGVPGLATAMGLFAGRNKLRAWFGYGVLAVLVVLFATVPGDPISAAFVGMVAVAYLATGRGTSKDDEFTEHHESRDTLTTTPSDT
jgi:hypothetical protein